MKKKSVKEMAEKVLEKNAGKSFNENFFKVLEKMVDTKNLNYKTLKKICTGRNFPSFATIIKYI